MKSRHRITYVVMTLTTLCLILLGGWIPFRFFVLCPIAGGPELEIPEEYHFRRGETVSIVATLDSDCVWPPRPVSNEVIFSPVHFRQFSSERTVKEGVVAMMLRKGTRWHADFQTEPFSVPDDIVSIDFQVRFRWDGLDENHHRKVTVVLEN